MDIKDLAGLSEPLKRLIEVTAEGIGAISHPLLIKRNADAKAYEIRAIAQAVADSQKLLGTVKYDEGNVIVESSPHQELLPPPEADIEQRILMRVAYQQAKKQSNIENVVQYAADDLRSEQEIAQEKPDSDWVTRFFNISEDISSDQMQILWGKILAGEIKKPGSYSLRTLELLKNINQREAELFVRACHIAFENLDKVFIPNPDRGKYIEEKFGLSFTDLLSLREVGLLVSNDLEFSLSPTPEDSENIFITGKTCIVVNRSKNIPKQHLTCIVFTGIGRQLFQIIEQSPADPEYIKKFAGFWRREGVEIKSGEIIEKQIGFINTTDKLLVEQALAAGYEVVAFVRNPSKLTTKHERLTALQGDVTDPVAVECAVQGADAVISVLNTQRNAESKPITRGTQNILAAMKKFGVHRLIMSASVPGNSEPNDLPDLRFKLKCGLVKWFVKNFLRSSYEDLIGAVQVVQASATDWTIVRLFPTNGTQTGQVKAGYVSKSMGMSISRADAAAFMLSEVREAKYVRQAPVISNG